jgi:hypothetical protein
MGTIGGLKRNTTEFKVHIIVLEDLVVEVKPSARCSFLVVIFDRRFRAHGFLLLVIEVVSDPTAGVGGWLAS